MFKEEIKNGQYIDNTKITFEEFIEITSKSGFTLNDIILKSNVAESVLPSLKLHMKIQPFTALKISNSLYMKIDFLFDEIVNAEPLSERTILHHLKRLT